MIDSHCHLYIDANSQKQKELVAEAVDSGVETIICIGIDSATSHKSIELAEQYDAVYATVGLHPHDARKFNDNLLKEFSMCVKHKRVLAVGEIGLDYYRNLSPHAVQINAFEAQLGLAAESNKPIVIHTRESLRDTIEIVKRYQSRLHGGVFHCFSGTADDAREVFELGFHISFGGVISYKNSGMSEVASVVPLDKVILETDAPYLTPVPFRGKQNRPSYVKYVYEKLAELRKTPMAEIEKSIDRNCKKLFGLVDTFEG